MKARKFWAVYIPLVALGLATFFISSASLESVPLVLSDAEMQEVFGSARINAKCVTRSPCYPDRSGDDCDNNKRFTSLGTTWKDCTSYQYKKCSKNAQITARVCAVTEYDGPGCSGEATTDQRTRTTSCRTSNM